MIKAKLKAPLSAVKEAADENSSMKSSMNSSFVNSVQSLVPLNLKDAKLRQPDEEDKGEPSSHNDMIVQSLNDSVHSLGKITLNKITTAPLAFHEI